MRYKTKDQLNFGGIYSQYNLGHCILYERKNHRGHTGLLNHNYFHYSLFSFSLVTLFSQILQGKLIAKLIIYLGTALSCLSVIDYSLKVCLLCCL